MRKDSWSVAFCALMLCASLLLAPAIYAPKAVPASSPTKSLSSPLPALTRQGLVLPMGAVDAADGLQVGNPSVLVDRGVYKMWFFEVDTSWLAQIAYATSTDGRNWTKHGAVLGPTYPSEGHDVAYPSVIRLGDMYWMWYAGFDGITYRIFAANSTDGTNWTKAGVVLDVGPVGSPDATSLVYPFVLNVNGTFYMWYTGLTSFSPPDNAAIMLATSTDGVSWTKQGVVLAPGGNESLDFYNAFSGSVIWDGSRFVMVYEGDTALLTSSLLYAVSADGMHWEKMGVALPSDPPREAYVAQPDLVLQPHGNWSLYYVVRNDTSDLQIYLASNGTSTPPSPPAPALAATITASPTNGTMPLTVTFNSTVTGGVAPYTYDWHLGDGATTTAANSVHIYLTGGNFTLWLTVRDSQEASARSNVVWVNVTASAVNLSVVPISPTQFTASSNGITATLTASVSGGTPPYTFLWAFGDGTTGTGPNPTHVYASPGLYSVTVTVTDAHGHVISRSFNLDVPAPTGPPPPAVPLALFALSVATGSAAAIALGILLVHRTRRGRPPE